MSEFISNILKLQQKRPFICLEVNPPRGTNFEDAFSRLENNLDGIDFLNVTDSALARMRCSALPFAAALKAKTGKEPLVNVSCRDRNLIALQADLLAGWAMGVRSIVALTGDAVSVGDAPNQKGVFEVNSIGLLQALATLNSGKDVVGNELNGAPNYVAGVVVNPNARNANAEIRRLAKKKEAGAAYALSQPVFDEKASKEFFEQAHTIGIPIFMGLLAFRTAKAAENITHVPGIRISDELLNVIRSQEGDIGRYSINHCLKLAELNRPWVSGYHIVSGVTPKLALRLAKTVAAWADTLA